MMTEEQAIEKAKKVYWISHILFGKLKKDQYSNQWYGISVARCWEDFYSIETLRSPSGLIHIREPVDCRMYRSQIIMLSSRINASEIVAMFQPKKN